MTYGLDKETEAEGVETEVPRDKPGALIVLLLSTIKNCCSSLLSTFLKTCGIIVTSRK